MHPLIELTKRLFVYDITFQIQYLDNSSDLTCQIKINPDIGVERIGVNIDQLTTQRHSINTGSMIDYRINEQTQFRINRSGYQVKITVAVPVKQFRRGLA